jgi:hypothetical protein
VHAAGIPGDAVGDARRGAETALGMGADEQGILRAKARAEGLNVRRGAEKNAGDTTVRGARHASALEAARRRVVDAERARDAGLLLVSDGLVVEAPGLFGGRGPSGRGGVVGLGRVAPHRPEGESLAGPRGRGHEQRGREEEGEGRPWARCGATHGASQAMAPSEVTRASEDVALLCAHTLPDGHWAPPAIAPPRQSVAANGLAELQ